MALEITKAQTRLNYTNEVNGYEITYTAYQDDGAMVTDIQVTAKKGTDRLLNGTVFSGGRKSVIIENGVPDTAAQALVETIIADTNKIFEQRNVNIEEKE